MEASKRKVWYFVLPGFSGVLLFYVLPFLVTIYYMFTQGIAEVHFVGLRNFSELMGNVAFQLSVRNTGLFLLVGVPAVTFLSLVFSLMLSRKRYRFTRWAMLLPTILPVASALIGWQVLLGDRGIVNRFLMSRANAMISFFGEEHAMKVLLFLFIVKNTGYMSVIFTGALMALKKEYREAFVLDSDSEWKYLTKIILPLLAPVIFFVVILCVVNSFQMFREVYGLYGPYPPNSVYLLQHFMNNNFRKLNYQRLSTAAFMVVMFIAVIMSLFLRVQDKNRR